MASVNLIVSCAKRKRRVPRLELRLRSVDPGASLEARAREWINRLRIAEGTRSRVEQLYAGDHWAVVRDLCENTSHTIDLWICSAGYGLVGPSAEVAPYSATFVPGDPDTVASAGVANATARWWDALARWEGPCSGEPRSIREVARRSPSTPLLVVLPAAYLSTVHEDLAAARNELEHPNLFAILSVGGKVPAGLAGHVLEVDASLRSSVGGAMASLNARLARKLLQEADDLRLPRLRDLTSGWSSVAQPEERPCRKKVTDEEIKAYLSVAFAASDTPRRTLLLQEFRKSGRACEQSRFARLFRETKGEAT